jgi:DNA-binding response OmpR family regulator
MANAAPPDLLILDLHLPRLAGREVLRTLRTGGAAGSLKILVLSADAMLGTEEEVLAAGADAYMSKPFDLHVFRATVGSLLL